MTVLHLELAQGSRSAGGAGVPYGASFIDGREKLGETLPTQLLGVDGYTKLSESQFIRLSRELGSDAFPDLRGTQVQFLKDLCLVANCSEEFFLSASKDQWLRTAIIGKKDPTALFSAEAIQQQCHTLISSITIHSIVVPWHLYWPKLQAVREEADAVASNRVYFPSTVLEVALSEKKSLAEKLSEWETRKEECAIASQWHERDGDQENTAPRPFWEIGPNDVKIVNSNFVGGGQADVWKISWRGGNFARKVFKHKHVFDAELEVVRRVSHPHIVYSFGVSMSPDKTQHSLLMELLDRDLFALIEDRVRLRGYSEPPLSRLESLDMLLQIARAMTHMHSLPEPVIHGDLKPKNILVSHCEILGDVSQYFVKVADFGSARILKSSSSSTFNPGDATTQYAAPEVLKAVSEKTSIPDDPKKIDVYSFGILAFQILTGLEPYKKCPSLRILKKPYQGVPNRGDLKQGIIDGTLRPPLHEACRRPNFWNDPDLLALVERCWDPAPSSRPSFSEVIDRLENVYNNLIQKPKVEEHVHPLSQEKKVDDAPQLVSTTSNGRAPLPEVNQVSDATSAAQVRLQSVQDKSKKASRISAFKSRYLLSWICISPGKTVE